MEATATMIKASELRIGNLVYGATREPYRVNVLILQALSANAYYVEPILLTPEILEKAGFVKLGENDRGQPQYGKGIQGPYGLVGYLNINRTYYQAMSEYYEFWEFALFGTTVNIIDHLHQLQNLYFALTGEELEINL